MNFILIVLLLQIVVQLVFCQSCTLNTGCNPSDIQTAITALSAAVDSMANVELSPSGGSEFNAMNEALQLHWPKIKPCMNLVPEVMLLDDDGGDDGPMIDTGIGGGLIASTEDASVTFDSRGCEFHNESSIQWQQDPCCNHRLNKCCRKHSVQTKKTLISGYHQDRLSACCSGSESEISNYITYWIKTIRPRKKNCEAKMTEAWKGLHKMFEGVGVCFRQLFEEQACDQDSDCTGDSTCRNGVCPKTGFEESTITKDFAVCLLDLVPKKVKPALKEKLGVTTDADLYARMASHISKGMCIKKSQPWERIGSFTDQASCETATSCNDGSGAACASSGSGFCGYGCRNDFCYGKYNPSHVPNENSCNDIGYCISTSGWLTKSQCEAQSYCTVWSKHNQTECESAYLCRRFPFREPACLKDGTYNANGEFTCDSSNNWYGMRYIKKCQNWNYHNEGACTSAGGTWTHPPETEADCLQYKHCVDGSGNPKDFDETECTACGMSYEPVFASSRGVWQSKKYIQAGTWKTQQDIPTNKWVESLDHQKIFEFLFKVASSQIVPVMLSSMHCGNEPYYQLMSAVSCACGETKGSNCFNMEPLTLANGLKFYRDGSERINVGPGSCEPSNYGNSETIEIDLKEETVVPPVQSKKRLQLYKRDGLSSQESVDVVDTSEAVVGSIVGSGISASSTSGSTINLCLSISDDYTVGSGHNTAAFAVKVNGKYYFKDITVTTDGVEICGDVSDATTYFPAKVVSGTTENIPESETSGALSNMYSNMWISFALVIIGLVAL